VLAIAVGVWVIVAVLTGALGFDLVHHEWVWVAVDAILIALNLRAATNFWRRHLRSDQLGRG
jgi:hypothetical protein